MLNNTQRKILQNWELDCPMVLRDWLASGSMSKDRGTYAACLRALASKIPSMDSLNLPNIVREISKPRGMLVTGPTGSGSQQLWLP